MRLANGRGNLFVIREDDMISIYTTENIIESIYQDSDNKYNVWYSFITKLRPNLNILLNKDTDYDTNNYNPVYMFQKDYDIEVEPEYIDEVGEDSYISLVTSLSFEKIDDYCAIFLLDIDKTKAEEISEKYGVICHSINDPNINPIFQDGIEKNVERKECKRGWDELLRPSMVYPSNSLVFVDRYLFLNDSDNITYQDGIDNVYEILDKILPPKLGVDYHVLFVFDASELSRSGVTFNTISNLLNKLKKKLSRPYNIIIETVSIDHNNGQYGETHNRRILSNYFIIRADRSLKAFRDTHSLYSQTLFLDWIASKGIIHAKHSDAPGIALRKYLCEINKAIKQLMRSAGVVAFIQNGRPTSIREIKNRMIKD